MGFLKKWSTAITGGKKGINISHVMNNLDSLEEMLGKQRVLKFHRKQPHVLYHYCSSLATKLHAAYIGDGDSRALVWQKKQWLQMVTQFPMCQNIIMI